MLLVLLYICSTRDRIFSKQCPYVEYGHRGGLFCTSRGARPAQATPPPFQALVPPFKALAKKKIPDIDEELEHRLEVAVVVPGVQHRVDLVHDDDGHVGDFARRSLGEQVHHFNMKCGSKLSSEVLFIFVDIKYFVDLLEESEYSHCLYNIMSTGDAATPKHPKNMHDKMAHLG